MITTDNRFVSETEKTNKTEYEKNSRQRKKGHAAFFCLLCLILLFSFNTGVFAAERFTVEPSASLNAMEECYDVLFSVTNNGEDANVTLRFEMNLYGSVYAFEQDAALARGSEKTVSMKVPSFFIENFSSGSWSNDQCNLIILSGSRQLQKTPIESYTFLSRDSHSLLVGLLSDHPNKLTWMDNAGNGIYVSGEEKYIRLETLSSDFTKDDLSSLQYLVIDDMNTAVLTQDQIDAICDWTMSGGALLIGTGGRPDTLDGFDQNFLDAVWAATFPGDPSYSDINYGSSYIDPGVNLDLRVRQTGDGVIAILPLGLGDYSDVASGFDGDSAFVYELQSIYDTLADYSRVSASVNNMNLPYYTEEAFNYLDERVSLTFGWLRLLIILYCILIGPLLYLILKKAGRREQIWVILPLVSILFVGIVMLAGSGNRLSGLKMNEVTVAGADGGGNKHIYLSGYHCSHKDWKVTFSDDCYAAAPRESNSYGGGDSITIRKDKEQLLLSVHPDGSFDRVRAMAYCENGQKGSLIYDETGGTVTNKTGQDLYYVLVSKNNNATLLRDVKNGATVSLKDTPHVEKTMLFDDGNCLRSLMSDFYYDEKFVEAQRIAALSIGVNDCLPEGGRDILIGVTDDPDQALKDETCEVGFLCLYGR